MVGTTILHYKILEKLGEGGMGVVYKAEDTKLKRFVALKFLSPHLTLKEDAVARFIYEAQTASSLDHQNICTIYEIDKSENDQLYIAMAYYDGETLKQKISRGPLPIEETVDIAIQSANGLAKAHEKGIIHRDIKPANIIVQPDGTVKIIDFGLSKLVGMDNISKSGSIFGTVAYMSEEQALGKEIDFRADVWSLGVVMYEMLTGQLPFQAEHEQTVIYYIINKEAKPVTILRPEVPAGLERIVNTALSKKVENRYQQMDDLLADLRVLKENPANVSVKYATAKRAALRFRNKWATSGLIAFLLILTIWLTSKWLNKNEIPSLSAPKNSIAVMYFDNYTGQPNLEKILVDLLITNLSRTEQLEVVSSQRLFDILKNLDRLNMQTIDRNVATEVANMAGAKTMLLGSIILVGEKLRITAQLIDVPTGNIVDSPQSDGAKVEDVFTMVDELTEQISISLGVFTIDGETKPIKVSDVTTHSFEAYKYYQQGQEAVQRFDFAAAARNFRQAVSIDSTFAMAHLYFALWSGNWQLSNPLRDLTPFRKSLALAERYSRNASSKERLFILAWQAAFNRDFQQAESLFVTYVNYYPNDKYGFWDLGWMLQINGNSKRTIQVVKRVLELDPSYAMAYAGLSYHYSVIGEHEKAISASIKYRDMQPDVPNTYDTAVDVYMEAGEFDKALQICEEGLKEKVQSMGWFYNRTAMIHLFKGDDDKARESISNYQLVGDTIGMYRDFGYADMYEGRYEKAVVSLKKRLMLAQESNRLYRAIVGNLDLAKLLSIQGDFNGALRAIADAEKISAQLHDPSYNPVFLIGTYFTGSAMVKKGDYAEAQVRADRIKALVEKGDYERYYLNFYHLLLAEMHLARGDGEAALVELNQHTADAAWSPRHLTMRAASYTLKGEFDKAIQAYNNFYNLVSCRFSIYGGDAFDYYYERSRVNYHLAKIYEQKGDTAQALKHYYKAIELWKNADAELPELIDAKSRYVKLKGVTEK